MRLNASIAGLIYRWSRFSNKALIVVFILLVLPALLFAAPHRSDVAVRDGSGKIKRSAAAKYEFKKSHPCPATGRSRGACPGYVIDHIKPLKRGGPDRPSNMQWQTKSAAKAKDRLE